MKILSLFYLELVLGQGASLELMSVLSSEEILKKWQSLSKITCKEYFSNDFVLSSWMKSWGLQT